MLYVSDIAERTGMTLVVCACAASTFVCSLHVAVPQPLVKRVVQSSVYRGLKQLPRRNDPRGLTLLVRARQTTLACFKYSLIRPLSADVGHEIPRCGGAVEPAVHLTIALMLACLQGVLAAASAFALGTLFALYRLIYGQTRPAAPARAPRAKRD